MGMTTAGRGPSGATEALSRSLALRLPARASSAAAAAAAADSRSRRPRRGDEGALELRRLL